MLLELTVEGTEKEEKGKAKLQTFSCSENVSMASSRFCVNVDRFTTADVDYQGHSYKNFKFGILESLCADVLLGLDFQTQHKSVTFAFGGDKSSLSVCGLSTVRVPPVEPFKHLSENCHPVITKSRFYSKEDRLFISEEIKRLLEEGIIEESKSPWRAQVVVVKSEKKRLVIDYSQTINRFTLLDAFPLPNINELVNRIARYRVFSTVDLKSAYHQLPLKEEDRKFTAFEACGKLFQFTRLPFGVTNGVSCFQRVVSQFVAEENLEGVFPYLDNITICGESKEDHDINLKQFFEAAERKNLLFNEKKTILTTKKLPILGYEIEDGKIRPDPARLKPLLEMKAPHDQKSFNRIIGFFSYYSKWIPNFSEKIRCLTQTKSFPVSDECAKTFENFKSIIVNAVVVAIDENIPFEVETDASNSAIAATLNQRGRPVAFFSRMLQGSEIKHSSIEKEAQAIIEALRHWRQFLTGKHFTLKTDQKSVAFMFNQQHKSKIKNDKIMRWKLELSCYSFDISYKPGKDNVVPDTFSRIIGALSTDKSLYKLHDALCHPGIVRMLHFVRVKNLPFSTEEIRRTVNNCQICRACKPQFHRTEPTRLIKATQPFERLSIDFKGPIPSCNKNRFFLCVIDEYSRFPFVFPCSDVSTESVIRSLTLLFSLFGMPAYIHSDRGTSFLSRELCNFLTEKGVATSRSTPYNPAGNGQVERYNGVIWRSITLALKSKNLPIENWQDVLPDVLHSMRSLLCTSTNATPHERFLMFSRRSSSGCSIPTGLLSQQPVLLKKHNRVSKYDPMVEEVDLLDANSNYALVRFPNGRESTVSTKHLAPAAGNDSTALPNENPLLEQTPPSSPQMKISDEIDTNTGETTIGHQDVEDVAPVTLRRSTRIRHPVDRLNL